MKSLSDIQDQKQRHRSSVKTEDGFYVHYLGQNYWFGEVFVEQLNGHHETFEAQSIKLIISGEMPIGPESHQDSWFWSNKQLFSDGYCERPCIMDMMWHWPDIDHLVPVPGHREAGPLRRDVPLEVCQYQLPVITN